jgi:Phospholipid-translocating ATPase N-terminal
MWFSKSDGRPPSLPRHWPKSSPSEIGERPNRVIAVGDDQSYSFNSNFVKTSKYELYSFLPKFLMEVLPISTLSTRT